MSRERHIVAFGGMTEAHAEPLQRYLVGLAGRERPRVCFLPTATGDSAERTVRFYESFRGCDTSHVGLFDRRLTDLRGHLLAQDVIQVGGGNTANMLAVWRVHGVDEILREAWEAGIVLTGSSAGAICWFEACVTDSFGDLAPLDDGLRLLGGSMCPHYDSEPGRRPAFQRLVGEGFPAGLAAEDDVALHFVGTELVEAVTSRPGGRAFRVELVDGHVREAELAVRLVDLPPPPR